MKNSKLKIFELLFTSLILCLPLNAFSQMLAPGAPGKDAQWATAGKQAIGTSASLDSKVWFTLADGALTEVYYPDVTVANIHKLEFVVVNPKTKKVEMETADATHEIKVTRPDSLSFQQINTAKSGEWKITKTYTTDVKRNTILIDVNFENQNQNLNLYVYFDPSINNTGMHDTAESGKDFLLTSEADKSIALVFTSKIEEVTSGFYGVSDGLEQLKTSGKITNVYKKAENGNVTQMAKISQPKHFTTVVSLASDFKKSIIKIDSSNIAVLQGYKSRSKDFFKAQAEYENEWSDYVKTLPKVEPKYQAQFNMAAMVLRAQEDKTVSGANVASLTIPWGGGKNANEDVGGGYHLVWSRDLYHVFTAYLALGDTAAANRALDFLFNIQQKPDGSFPQNSQLDGTKGWGSLQMDEVAYPLIMAYQLKRFDKKTYENHVKKAADFIIKNGPKTPQERWEEKPGYSPSTIAAEIAGLVCAAEIARKNNDETSANLYLKTADDWTANIEKWTVTTNGKFGDGNYYVRLTANGKPDAGEKIELSNSSGAFFENEIVDAGFLELVRLGIKSPDDSLIVKSLKVIDAQIKVNTPNGESFYRYNHDGYGEQPDGRRWNFDGTYSGTGRLWALLTGERGQYELAKCYEFLESDHKRSDGKCETNGKNRLDAMLNFANEGLMIPEQIWDKRDTPKNIDKQFVPELKFGEGTGSATPLAWSMAQFIRLAVNLQAGKNLDTPDVVYNRYVLGKKETTEKNITMGVPQPLPNNPNLQNILNLKLEESCFSDWRNNQSVAQQNDLAKSLKRSPGFWSCKNGDVLAILVYDGKAKKVQIAGDFNSWKTDSEDYDFDDYSNDGMVKSFSMQFKPTARIEYKLIVDGKWITDPLNPNKVDNGVGGENSYFTMPDYKPTNLDGGEVPKLEIIEIDSKVFGEKRKIQVYVPRSESSAIADGSNLKVQNSNESAAISKFQPSATADGSDSSTLYLQDGSDYVNRAKAVQIQQNLVKAGKIKPFIMVFLDPKDRMKEYWANDDYAKYVATEVVPIIDKQYKTIKSRDARAIMGASLGGITSVNAALKYPEIFGRVGGQSSSFWVDNERIVKDLEKLNIQTKFKFYFDDGTLEGVEDSRKVVKILQNKGFDVNYNETEAGHNWTAWRDRLADAFITIWK